jgi:hypothetical protein
VFIGSPGMRATVKRAKAAVDASVEIHVVDVAMKGDYAAGTLVVHARVCHSSNELARQVPAPGPRP